MEKNENNSLFELVLNLNTHEKCIEFFEKVQTYRPCPKCNNNQSNYYLKTRKVFKCCKCGKQFSIISDTVFHGTKVPLHKWIIAIRLFVLDNVKSTKLAQLLELEQQTAWRMVMKIRKAISNIYENDILFGRVEVDETFLGASREKDLRLGYKISQSNKKGFQLDYQIVVLGLLQRPIPEEDIRRKVILKVIGFSKRAINRDVILPILEKYIDRNTEVYTDGHPVYKSLSDMFSMHFTVEHSKKEDYFRKDGTVGKKMVKNYYKKVSLFDVHTNNIENVWKHLKRTSKEPHIQISHAHAQLYMDEFAFRTNNSCLTPLEAFIKLLKICLTSKHTSCSELKRYSRQRLYNEEMKEYIWKQFRL